MTRTQERITKAVKSAGSLTVEGLKHKLGSIRPGPLMRSVKCMIRAGLLVEGRGGKLRAV
jgi:hypothetical protein